MSLYRHEQLSIRSHMFLTVIYVMLMVHSVQDWVGVRRSERGSSLVTGRR